MLAFALMHEFCSATAVDPEDGSNFEDVLRPGDVLRFAGSGFRRAVTRIAESSPEMWRDICLANRHVLSDEIEAYQRQLAENPGKCCNGGMAIP